MVQLLIVELHLLKARQFPQPQGRVEYSLALQAVLPQSLRLVQPHSRGEIQLEVLAQQFRNVVRRLTGLDVYARNAQSRPQGKRPF